MEILFAICGLFIVIKLWPYETEDRTPIHKRIYCSKYPHLLRRFHAYTSTKSELTKSESSFLFFGNTKNSNSHSYKATTIRFMWQKSSGEYSISELPMGNVHFIFDNPKNPFLTINEWDETNMGMCRIAIHCSESDIPVQLDFTKL